MLSNLMVFVMIYLKKLKLGTNHYDGRVEIKFHHRSDITANTDLGQQILARGT